MRTTHTYAILKVTKDVYHEIREKLIAAGYGGQFHRDDGSEVIDMNGIALQEEEEVQKGCPCPSHHPSCDCDGRAGDR